MDGWMVVKAVAALLRCADARGPDTSAAEHISLLQHTVLSICIGTHGQKNIRLTGASIAPPAACRSTSALIIHGHVHVRAAQKLC